MKQDIVNMFIGKEYHYSSKCKLRIGLGFLLLFLGVWAILSSAGSAEYAKNFYVGTGMGVLAASVITIIKNIRYLRREDLLARMEIYEKDERNRLLGLKCWSYAGYGTFIGLYVGLLVFGKSNEIVLQTLLAVMGGFGLLLLLARVVLSKIM